MSHLLERLLCMLTSTLSTLFSDALEQVAISTILSYALTDRRAVSGDVGCELLLKGAVTYLTAIISVIVMLINIRCRHQLQEGK